jgi:hypothetical protein
MMGKYLYNSPKISFSSSPGKYLLYNLQVEEKSEKHPSFTQLNPLIFADIFNNKNNPF